MSVGPVTLGGMIQRANDVSTIKHQEDTKPMVDQQAIQTHLKHEELRHVRQVRQADDSDNYQKKYDAKEKGSNEYHGEQKKKRHPNEKKDGTVFLKQGESGHFDMKI